LHVDDSFPSILTDLKPSGPALLDLKIVPSKKIAVVITDSLLPEISYCSVDDMFLRRVLRKPVGKWEVIVFARI